MKSSASLRELSKNTAIYGFGDVGITLINFLLLPWYVEYLSQTEYGLIYLLNGVELVAKIMSRWGVDGAFMRFYYDEDADGRRRLASTLFFFLLTANGVLFGGAIAAGGPLAARVLGSADHALLLQLTLLNTFLIGFTFLPFHVLRMEQRAVEFSALTLSRSVATLLLRILLIMGLGMGVLGLVLADIAVTAVLIIVLAVRFGRMITTAFSWQTLKESLRFGLPRLPHAGAQQIIAAADKFILNLYRPLSEVGLYGMGVSFGLTSKLFLSAFESAWAPFYYSAARRADGPAVLRSVTTYAVAVLALLTAGLSAAAYDLLDLMTRGQFVGAANVVGWIALGVFLQGIYLLTSIGLNVSKQTSYYPVATISAAVVNVGLNFAVIPRYGIEGAAWANAAAYAVQASVAYRFSQRFYPIDYDWGRVMRVIAAGLLAYGAARAVPVSGPAIALVLRGLITVAVFGIVLALTGFFDSREIATLRGLRRRGRE